MGVPTSKRPHDSQLLQQTLSSWQPIYDKKTSLPIFVGIFVVFLAVAVAVLNTCAPSHEVAFDYTGCKSIDDDDVSCWQQIDNSSVSAPCLCSVSFTLKKSFDAEVFIYYGLTNFFQSHRDYQDSYDEKQLRGSLHLDVSSECEPFAYVQDEDNYTKPIVPCGAVANSLFNDTFTLLDSNGSVVPLLKTGIAWPHDKKYRFANPQSSVNSSLMDVYQKDFGKPPNWPKYVWELDPDNSDNNGLQNEDLIVWMRTASFPTFTKLYRRVDHSSGRYVNGLPSGNYTMNVTYNYPVVGFGGTKRFVIANTSVLGSNNLALSVAYLLFAVVALMSVLLCFSRVHEIILPLVPLRSNDLQAPSSMQDAVQRRFLREQMENVWNEYLQETTATDQR